MCTKLLILNELVNSSHATFTSLSQKLDLTVQAVSNYIHDLTTNGLVHVVEGIYRPTKQGIQFLQEHLGELQNFVTSAIENLNVIRVCTAIARTPICKGDKVGLFMEDGELVAYVGKSSTSKGIAISDAAIGDAVGIQQLEGIVELKIGEVYIVEVPDVLQVGEKLKTVLTHVRTIYEKQHSPERVAVAGTIAKVIATKLNLKIDIEYGTLEAVKEAVCRGLSVMVIATPDLVERFVQMFNETNRRSDIKIDYKIYKAY